MSMNDVVFGMLVEELSDCFLMRKEIEDRWNSENTPMASISSS